MGDVEALLGLNVCNPEEEEKCREEIGSDEFLQWACEKCEKKKNRDIHPWTHHLLRLRRLVMAGYPFGKNDLSYQEWLDLGLVSEMIEARKML